MEGALRRVGKVRHPPRVPRGTHNFYGTEEDQGEQHNLRVKDTEGSKKSSRQLKGAEGQQMVRTKVASG